MFRVCIGGVWAHSLGHYGKLGGLEINTCYATDGSGLKYAKWQMDLPPNYYHSVFEKGTKVELFRNETKLGSLNIADVDRTTMTFKADGLFRRAEQFYANVPDEENPPTTTEVIEEANANGLGWNGVGNLPTIDWSGRNGQSIASVLTDHAEVNSLRWGLTVEDEPYMEAEPYLYDPATKPQWAIRPGVKLMPTTDGSYVRRVWVGYRIPGVTVPGVPSTYGRAVSDALVDLDITPEGGHDLYLYDESVVSGAVATAKANEVQRRNALRYTFTQGLDIKPGQLTTPGGTRIANWAAGLLVVGRMGVHYGAISTRNNSAAGETVQWVAGSATYWEEGDRLLLASVDAPARSHKAVLASYAGKGRPGQRMSS